MDFGRIEKAGRTQAEFAQLSGGVSRTTVSLWVTGKFRPHRFIEDKVAEKLAVISAALERGLLPLKPNTPTSKRAQLIERALADASVPA